MPRDPAGTFEPVTVPKYRRQLDGLAATAGWVYWFNNRRLRSLDHLNPDEFEQAHYAAISREPQPA